MSSFYEEVNKENDIYILMTSYQLLISLLKIKTINRDTLLLIDSNISEDVLIRLKKEEAFKEIEIKSDSDYFSLKKPWFSELEKKKFLKFINCFKNINIFIDHFNIGHILNKYEIPYNLLEDGYNVFQFKSQNFMDRIFTKDFYFQDYKDLIKHLFFLKTSKPGFGKYCQSIEVNDISVVPKDERYHKFKEVPRKDLFNNISEERKQLILRVFGVEELSGVTDKSVLILTQPLSLDRLMNSDDKQCEFYKKICDKYLSEGYEVYLKPHPRDTINYEKINGVKLIAQTVPMELIEMVSDVKFERIITHSSTAINFLTCGEEKEVFYDFNTQEYDEKLLEKYKINKDEL